MKYTEEQQEALEEFYENIILSKAKRIEFLNWLRVTHNESLFINPETLFIDPENLNLFQKVSTWVNNLKSGIFTQSKGALFSKDFTKEEPCVVGYCCLGVLAATFQTTEFEKRFKVSAGKLVNPQFLYSNLGELNSSINKILSSHISRNFKSDYVQNISMKEISLVVLNDSWDFTFNDIANQVEADLNLIKQKREKEHNG
jgi:hypothetical protein